MNKPDPSETQSNNTRPETDLERRHREAHEKWLNAETKEQGDKAQEEIRMLLSETQSETLQGCIDALRQIVDLANLNDETRNIIRAVGGKLLVVQRELTALKSPLVSLTPLTGTWTCQCAVCGKQYVDWCGSTPCCGALAEIISHTPEAALKSPELPGDEKARRLELADKWYNWIVEGDEYMRDSLSGFHQWIKDAILSALFEASLAHQREQQVRDNQILAEIQERDAAHQREREALLEAVAAVLLAPKHAWSWLPKLKEAFENALPEPPKP